MKRAVSFCEVCDRLASGRRDCQFRIAFNCLKSYHLDKSHTPCGAVAGLEELGQCGVKVSLLDWRVDETANSDGAPKGGAGLTGQRKHHERSCDHLEDQPKNRGVSQAQHDVRFENLLKLRIDPLCHKT